MTLYFYSLVRKIKSEEMCVVEETAEVKETTFKYISLNKEEFPRRYIKQIDKDVVELGKVFTSSSGLSCGTIYQVILSKSDREEAIRLLKDFAEAILEELKIKEERQRNIIEAIK